MSRINYYLYNPSGGNFETFQSLGVFVAGSKGLTDLPKPKTQLKNEWNDRDGYNIDLTRRTYQQREITLECWIKASGYVDFVNKTNAFCNRWMTQGAGSGVQYLKVELDSTRRDGALHFMVYLDGGVAYNKKWHEGQMVGTFNIKLIEAEPLKTVIVPHYPAADYPTMHNNSQLKLNVKFRALRLCKIYFETASSITGNLAQGWTYDVIGEQDFDIIQNDTDADNTLLIYGNPADIRWTGSDSNSVPRGIHPYISGTLDTTINLLTTNNSPIVWNAI